jgi:drug/metabolite transporter (DMT)-like permease
MFAGIVAALAAGALWALAFIAPSLILPFGAADLTIVRYTVFGISSFGLLLLWPKRRWWPVAKAHWQTILVLAATGNTLYYLLLSEAIQWSGSLLPTMIIGALPVVMALLGGLKSGVFSPRRFSISAVFILAGLFLHIFLANESSQSGYSHPATTLGSCMAIAALGSWAYYGLKNAEVLSTFKEIDLVAWTALTGVATLVTLLPVALLIPSHGVTNWFNASMNGDALLRWGIILGLLSSWLATWFWNAASRVLSADRLGYLIVSETIFAVVYAFLVAWRLPTPTELLSVMLLVIGVVIGIRITSSSKEVLS